MITKQLLAVSSHDPHKPDLVHTPEGAVSSLHKLGFVQQHHMTEGRNTVHEHKSGLYRAKVDHQNHKIEIHHMHGRDDAPPVSIDLEHIPKDASLHHSIKSILESRTGHKFE